MCLNTITKQYAKPNAKERWAWKAFELYKGHLAPLCMETPPRFKRGIWLRARNCDVWLGIAAKYTAGFHAFTSRTAATEWGSWSNDMPTVLRVKLRGVHTVGTQDGHRVLVADEMWIPPAKKAGTA